MDARDLLIRNEQAKLTATYLNGVAIALAAVGGFAPWIGSAQTGQMSPSRDPDTRLRPSFDGPTYRCATRAPSFGDVMEFGTLLYWFLGPASMVMAALLVMFFTREREPKPK